MNDRTAVPRPRLGPAAARRSALRAALVLAGATIASPPAGAGGGGQPVVAAASDLQFALGAIADAFAAAGGQRPRIVFGSSGNFHAQILQGAPFELFLSADERYAARLVEAGLTQGPGRVYARGRIAIMVAPESPLRADGSLADLAAAVRDGRLRRFAIANPAHAPYGDRARQALVHARLWDAIRERLVYGENVSQAAQFIATGAVEGGIVALSLARAPAIGARARFAPIDPGWHSPLVQRMVLLRKASPGAHAFYDFVASPAAREILGRFGFEAAPAD